MNLIPAVPSGATERHEGIAFDVVMGTQMPVVPVGEQRPANHNAADIEANVRETGETSIAQLAVAAPPRTGHERAVLHCATPPARITLPMNSLAARTARKFLTHVCCDSHQARVLEDAQLILTELVANAVLHGAPPIELEVSCAGTEALQVRVRDTSPDQLRPRSAATDAENGRGLALVDLLSDAWGVDVDPLGKTVWFRLAGP